MFTPLATPKQLAYLQHLADRAQFIKMRHPSLIPLGLMHTTFNYGLTSERARLLIQMYSHILDECNAVLYRQRTPKQVAVVDDLPE